jgi:hypothetical protein
MKPNKIRLRWVQHSLVGLLFAVLAFTLAACQGAASSAASTKSGGTTNGVKVEVVYLNHPPVRPILDQINQVLAGYGDKVLVTRYDFDTPEGGAFAKKNGLTGHLPLAIFIDGSESFDLSGRKVKFESFPQGGGMMGMVPDGAWSINDLDAVLKTKVGK